METPPSDPTQPTQLPLKMCVQPTAGEVITSMASGNTYTIGAKIGEGAFSIVYFCQDEWKNELAVKVLKPVGTYETVKASAQAEIEKLFYLRHPNITYVYDAFEYRDTFYIVTEKCLGPLSDLFTIQNYDGILWLLPVARCLLQALHYIHLNNVVHQDIHLRNVFTTFVKDEMPTEARAIQFKLADLGVAKLLNQLDGTNTRAQWMLPPEILRPHEFGPIDHRIDIYHAGLLFLQLAHGKEQTFTPDEVLQGKPRELALTLPQPYNFALEKTLRRHVAARTSSAMEIWRDLNALQPAPLPNLLPPADDSQSVF